MKLSLCSFQFLKIRTFDFFDLKTSVAKKYGFLTRIFYNGCIPLLFFPCIINSCLCRFAVCELDENNYTTYSDGCVSVFYREINKDSEPDLEWFGNVNNITDSELLMIVIVLQKYLDIFEERKYINCNFMEYILDIYRLLFGENIYRELKGSFIHNDYNKFIDDCRTLILIILTGIIKCNTLPK